MKRLGSQGTKSVLLLLFNENETGKENPSQTGLRVLIMGRKTLTNRPPGTQSGKENPDKPAACGTHELLTILQFTFVRLLQLACPCSSSTFGRLLTCVSLQFFDFRSCLCSSSSKNCVLTLSCPNVVFTALAGSENSWWNLLFVSKKVDLVDLELLAVDLVDLK